jgi:ABC-type nitrate/sulfonate/bicarbonate transport system permease component
MAFKTTSIFEMYSATPILSKPRFSSGVNQYGLKPETTYDYLNPTQLVNFGAGTIRNYDPSTDLTISGLNSTVSGRLEIAVASNSIPIVAMAPIAIVWFGIGPESKIAIVAVMCFFPTLVSAVRGLNAAGPDAIALLRSYAATDWQIFAKLRVPTALPFIFNAFKICTAVSMIGAIVAEFFGGAVNYLGVYIKTEASILRTPNAWAAIVVACIFGLGFYLAVVLAERALMPWHREQ